MPDFMDERFVGKEKGIVADVQKEKEKLACEGIPFIDLRDSPIFRSTAREVEGSLESMHKRTRKIIHGAEMYCRALDDAFHESLRFASLIEAQCSPKGVGGEGAGEEDDDDDDEQERLKLGGPVISRFVQSMRELSSFIELLRTQVQIVMCDRLEHHSGQALERVKQCRKSLQQRNADYDAVRSKHLGHRKLLSNFEAGMKRGESGEAPEKLMQCRVKADEARYDLARALVEAKGQFRYELLESVANVMQAHAKYFEHGNAVAGNMSGYIDDCLEYVSALKSQSNGTLSSLEKLIEREVHLWKEHEIKLSQMEDEKVKQLYGLEEDGRMDHGPLQVTSASHELAGKIQQFIARTVASDGKEVTILKQGYLLKRSSKMRAKWQRRFFVLDSTGMLYYYSTKSEGGADFVKKKERPQNTVNLVTAAVKKGLDAEDKQVPFSFRIVSPEREYSLQAEDDIDAQAWMDMLQGVIVSLLSGALESNVTVESPRILPSQAKTPLRPTHSRDLSSDMSSYAMLAGESGHDIGRADTLNGPSISPISSIIHSSSRVSVLSILSSVSGNERCADCSAPNPDWASLNIGALYCIECSGFHRKLGVHISKIRSLTLDTRVWDDTVVQLFQHLGNGKVNDIWEGILSLNIEGDDESTWSDNTGEIKNKFQDLQVLKHLVDVIHSTPKPEATAPAASKEKYIHAKYVTKSFLIPLDGNPEDDLWNSIESGDVLKCYKALLYSSPGERSPEQKTSKLENEVDHMMKCAEKQEAPATATALHYACKFDSLLILELLLQWGFQIDAKDGKGRSPLAYAIEFDKPLIARHLLSRGACSGSQHANERLSLSTRLQSKCASEPELVRILMNL